MDAGIRDRVERRAGHPDALGVGRGLAIVMVMYGHALTPWVMGGPEQFSQTAFLQWKLGAAFLMMFFFFVSGMAWREKTSLKATFRKSLALILIAWSVSAVVQLMFVALSWASLSPAFGLQPLGAWDFVKNIIRTGLFADQYAMTTMWFLTALGVARMLAAVLARFASPLPAAVATVLLIGYGLLSVALGWRNYYQTAELGVVLVAFFAGHSAGNLFARLDRDAAPAAIVWLVSGAVLFSTFALNQGCPFDPGARCPMPWIGDEFSVVASWGVWGFLPLFAVTASAGVVWLAMTSSLLARFGGAMGWRLAAWGRNTIALLVVNGAYVEFIHPLVARYVAPRVDAEGPIFFVLLLAFTLAVNFGVAALLRAPLKLWFATATKAAGLIADTPRRLALYAARRDSVSTGP